MSASWTAGGHHSCSQYQGGSWCGDPAINNEAQIMPPGVPVFNNVNSAQHFPASFALLGEAAAVSGSGGAGAFNKYWRKYRERKELDRHLIKARYCSGGGVGGGGSGGDNSISTDPFASPTEAPSMSGGAGDIHPSLHVNLDQRGHGALPGELSVSIIFPNTSLGQ
jgi:hypothetical protein